MWDVGPKLAIEISSIESESSFQLIRDSIFEYQSINNQYIQLDWTGQSERLCLVLFKTCQYVVYSTMMINPPKGLGEEV